VTPSTTCLGTARATGPDGNGEQEGQPAEKKKKPRQLTLDSLLRPSGWNKKFHSKRKKIVQALETIKKAIRNVEMDILKHAERNCNNPMSQEYRQHRKALKARKVELQMQEQAARKGIDEALRLLSSAGDKPQIKEQEHRINREVYRLESKLPALAKRNEIEERLKDHQFLVVKGHTGSGKSTQIPQYLADMPMFKDMKVRLHRSTSK